MRVTAFNAALGADASPARADVREFPSAGAFLDWLETVPSRECADNDAKLGSPAFALATWRPGARRKDHALVSDDATTQALAFDLDSMSPAEVNAAAAQWRGLDWVLYSTWKHTPAAPRLRLVVALDAPLEVRNKRAFGAVYRAAARRLGVTYDGQAASASNLYFFPQHRPGVDPASLVRVRMRGAGLSLAVLRAAAAAEPDPDVVEGPAGVTARPDRGELKQISQKLRKRQSASHRRGGLALAAVLRSEAYAGAGHVYGATQDLAFALAFETPDLDEPWFRDQFLEPCWRVMWPGEDLAAAERDWSNAWRSACERRAQHIADRAAERAALQPDVAPLSENGHANASAHGGALIVVHGTAYYVFDPEAGRYTAPVRGGGVAARARDLLSGVGGVQVLEPRENGRPCPKSPTQLIADYGTAIDQVHYWATPPDGPCFDRESRSIRCPAYRWNDFEVQHHAIVDDLWRSMAGDRYAQLEAWLSKLRALSRPLPALVLVGPKGVWKSKTAQTLSRFWGDRDAPTACRAQQVLGRFSAPLLTNPVVWSDEHLAVDERGREIPERYRESISEVTHQVERKGIDPVTLHTALRHVISVNDIAKVFSREIHGDAVEATLERYLVVDIDGGTMAAFEARWAGRPELACLRAPGCTWMLEHVRWIEEHRAVPDAGRFGVETATDPEVIDRARFQGAVLNLILQVATDALLAEAGRSPAGDPARMPIRRLGGVLRFSPRVLVELWPDSKAARGFRGSIPTIAEVGQILDGAGLRADGDGGPDGFPFDAAQWGKWLKISEIYDVEAVGAALRTVLS